MASTKPPTLDQRVGALEQQMAEVLAKPAFKNRTERGVCTKGVEDSEHCEFASLGRMQGGCKGWACLAEGQSYYKAYRARQKAKEAAEGGTPVANPRRRSTATTEANPKAPGTIKRVRKKAGAPATPTKRIKRRGAG